MPLLAPKPVRCGARHEDMLSQDTVRPGTWPLPFSTSDTIISPQKRGKQMYPFTEGLEKNMKKQTCFNVHLAILPQET